LRKRQELFEQSVDDLRQAIALRPDQYQAHWNLANTFEHFKQVEEAIEQLDQAIHAARSLIAANDLADSTLVLLYHHRAQLHLQRQDWEAAVGDVQQALQIRPYAEGYVVLGRDLQRRQRYKEAAAAYEDALETPPANARSLRRAEIDLHRAEALLQLGEYQEAAGSLDRSLGEADRPGAYVFQLRGLARAKLGDYAGAVSDYTQALRLKPGDSLTHAYRGWVYLVQDALRPALHDFQAAIRLDPDNADAYTGRGYIRVRLGDAAGAVQDAEEALRRGPRTPRMVWNAARVYAQSVSVLDVKKPVPSGADLAIRTRHQNRALELLGEALALTPADQRGAFWQSYVQPDVAGVFGSLRRSPEFVRLSSEYEQASK
jgi:tetratricopeptide (TPR) repeat protein